MIDLTIKTFSFGAVLHMRSWLCAGVAKVGLIGSKLCLAQVSCVKPCVEFSTCGRVEMFCDLMAVPRWETPRRAESERQRSPLSLLAGVREGCPLAKKLLL